MATATAAHVHPHEHLHEHPHEHPHVQGGAVVVESGQHHGPSHDGSVVLDIGGDVGAVVLTVPADLAALEIDIEGLGAGTVSTHSLVRPRIMPQGTVYAAVYPGLPQGSYRIPSTAGHPALELEVVGGSVAQVSWAAPARETAPSIVRPSGRSTSDRPTTGGHPQPPLHDEGRSA